MNLCIVERKRKARTSSVKAKMEQEWNKSATFWLGAKRIYLANDQKKRGYQKNLFSKWSERKGQLASIIDRVKEIYGRKNVYKNFLWTHLRSKAIGHHLKKNSINIFPCLHDMHWLLISKRMTNIDYNSKMVVQTNKIGKGMNICHLLRRKQKIKL